MKKTTTEATGTPEVSKTPEQIYNDLWYKKDVELSMLEKTISQEWLADMYHIEHQWALPNKITVNIDWYTIDVLLKSINEKYNVVQSKFHELNDAVSDFSSLYRDFSFILWSAISEKINTDYKDTMDVWREDNRLMTENMKEKMWKKE